MKPLILGIFMILNFLGYSQRVDRFLDSLTISPKNIWIDINGSEFTEIGENCNYGIEVTFLKQDNQVIFNQCHEGEWKRFEYRFEVMSADGEHFIEIYDTNEKIEDYEFEAQWISDDEGNFITELTLYYYREKRAYTLRTKN